MCVAVQLPLLQPRQHSIVQAPYAFGGFQDTSPPLRLLFQRVRGYENSTKHRYSLCPRKCSVASKLGEGPGRSLLFLPTKRSVGGFRQLICVSVFAVSRVEGGGQEVLVCHGRHSDFRVHQSLSEVLKRQRILSPP